MTERAIVKMREYLESVNRDVVSLGDIINKCQELEAQEDKAEDKAEAKEKPTKILVVDDEPSFIREAAAEMVKEAQKPTAPASLVEELADLEHRRWSHWQKHVHDCLVFIDGAWVLPTARKEYWDKEIATDYKDLNERQKEWDRVEARKSLELISRYRPTPQADILGEMIKEIHALSFQMGGEYLIEADTAVEIIRKFEGGVK